MEELNALNDSEVEMRKVYIQRKLKRVVVMEVLKCYANKY